MTKLELEVLKMTKEREDTLISVYREFGFKFLRPKYKIIMAQRRALAKLGGKI